MLTISKGLSVKEPQGLKLKLLSTEKKAQCRAVKALTQLKPISGLVLKTSQHVHVAYAGHEPFQAECMQNIK